MSNGARIASSVAAMTPEVRAHVNALLRQIVHDINTPISTVSMEVFSARILLSRLREIGGEDSTESARIIEEILGICENMERTTLKLSDCASNLDRLASLTPAVADEYTVGRGAIVVDDASGGDPGEG